MHDLGLEDQHKSQQTRLQERLAAAYDHTDDSGASTGAGAGAPPVEIGVDYLSLIRAKTPEDAERVQAEFGHSEMAMSILSKPMPGLGGSDRFHSTFMQAQPITPAAVPTIRVAVPAGILEGNTEVEDDEEENDDDTAEVEESADVWVDTATHKTAVASTMSTRVRGTG